MEFYGMESGPWISVLTERGAGLDAIGSRPEVDLQRKDAETDLDYRDRIIVKMQWSSGYMRTIDIHGVEAYEKARKAMKASEIWEIDGLPYFVQGVQIDMPSARGIVNLMPRIPAEWLDIHVATGKWLDHEWHGPMGAETKAPEDESRQNHLRDAVRNNW